MSQTRLQNYAAFASCYEAKLFLADIINMSVGFFGIQFGFGLQNANVGRIFQSSRRQCIDKIPIYG